MRVFVAATHTARSGARTGIQTVVRGILRNPYAVPLVWNTRRRILHPLRPEWYANLDLAPGPERLAPGTLVSPVNWPAWLTSFGEMNRVPLHFHPEWRRELADSWLLMPELMEGEVVSGMAEYARRHRMKCAAIFHDAIPILRPDLTERGAEQHAAYMRALAALDLVISVSEFSADCLREWLSKNQIPCPKIVTCPLPAESIGQPRITTPKNRVGTPLKLLCVCTLEPRKNHATLLKAFRQLTIPAELHLAGTSYSGAPEIATNIEAMQKADPRIRWHGSLTQAQIADLYALSDFSVYPSFLEGFGLPVVESLWQGRPCVCANFGVMAESARGGGCLTVDVLNASALACGIEQLATDSGLYQRLSREAVTRPLRTWTDYAKEVCTLL